MLRSLAVRDLDSGGDSVAGAYNLCLKGVWLPERGWQRLSNGGPLKSSLVKGMPKSVRGRYPMFAWGQRMARPTRRRGVVDAV